MPPTLRPRPARSTPAARIPDVALAANDAAEPWRGETVEVGRLRLYVRRTPAGPDAEPALFVHGLGGSALNWTDFAAVLRDRLAIEAIDLPGHGRSAPPPRNDYSPGAHARAVIAYLEQSGRGPVHLVGNSMGGAVSILVAAQRPDLVRTLTLISPAVPDNRVRIYPLKSNPRFALVAVPVLGEWAVRKFNQRYAPEVRAKGTIALCFSNPKRYPARRLQESIEETRERAERPWAEAAVLRSLRGLATAQLLRGRRGWATMRRITAPTLVLWGERDRLVAPDLAPYVAAAIPDARLLVLPDVGHVAMMEQPEVAARALVGLLEDAASAAEPKSA